MSYVNSFPPVADANAYCLILGSMPGRASLGAHQYYAHPRNVFWPIMASIFGFAVDAPYQQRCTSLTQHGVALWDVLHACDRPGSLDSAIVASSMVPHDLVGFFQRHQTIRAVYFNGAMAEKAYRKQVVPLLTEPFAGLPTVRLPSTSPAHAALSYQDKLAQWQVIRSDQVTITGV
jgi:TDG/mug DNA glycosylase family protein